MRAIRRGFERNQCDAPSARKSILPDLTRDQMSDCVQIKSTARSRRAVVVSQQPAEESAAANVVRLERVCIIQDGIRRTRSRDVFRWAGRIELPPRGIGNGEIPQALMRPKSVVEMSVLAFDVVEMAEAETHEMVQAFALEGTDPRFHERVGVGREQRRADRRDAGVSEQLVERERKLRVAVVKNKLRPKLLIIEPHHHVAGLLLDPALIRVKRRRREEHPPRAQVNERQAEGKPRPEGREDRLREEVARDERVHVQADESAPSGVAGLATARGRRRQARLEQYPTNSRAADPQAKLLQFAEDATM